MSASGPGGSIYDLGYQSYTGPRLGRRSAVRALFSQTIRACFGIGRGGRAKIAPFTLGGHRDPARGARRRVRGARRPGGPGGAVIENASPIRYDSYHGLVSVLIMLFCAAQAPELFGRDQRYGVLPLYFSRVLTRTDYALAKVFGLMVALFAVDVTPYLILFVGRVFVAPDPATGLADEIAVVPKFLLQAVLVAGLLGGIASLIASYTPRRAYATAAIIAVFIIPPIIVGDRRRPDGQDLARVTSCSARPTSSPAPTRRSSGPISDNPVVLSVDLPGWAYVAAAAIGIVAAIGLTVRRYLRIAA